MVQKMRLDILGQINPLEAKIQKLESKGETDTKEEKSITLANDQLLG
jgi:hypothetical protein